MLVDGAEGRPVRRAAVLPKAGIQVLDDWRVLVMRGTGSSAASRSKGPTYPTR
ncbi:hypothetical protein [Streptomyces sp. NPDC088727]|uniref:hypothetical protein n=1 Tax=Streptomyces sp. NPDC088727 TaxID=3365875 RepID=UPI00381CA9C0